MNFLHCIKIGFTFWRWVHFILTKEDRRTISYCIFLLYLFCHELQQLAGIGQKEKCRLSLAGLWVNKWWVGEILLSHTHNMNKSRKCGAVQTGLWNFPPVWSGVGPDVTCLPQKNNKLHPMEVKVKVRDADAQYFYFIFAYWTIEWIQKHRKQDKHDVKELKFQKGAVQSYHEWLQWRFSGFFFSLWVLAVVWVLPLRFILTFMCSHQGDLLWILNIPNKQWPTCD